MRARFKRFCVGVFLVGLFVACVPLAYTLPASVQLGAALAGFGAALGTLGGVAWLLITRVIRERKNVQVCRYLDIIGVAVGGAGVPVKSKESLPASM